MPERRAIRKLAECRTPNMEGLAHHAQRFFKLRGFGGWSVAAGQVAVIGAEILEVMRLDVRKLHYEKEGNKHSKMVAIDWSLIDGRYLGNYALLKPRHAVYR
jgi:hypothetical protein